MKIGKRVRSSTSIKTSVPIKRINLTDDVTDWSTWVAATSTRNYLLDDGYLDYLKETSSSGSNINNNLKNGDNFTTSIMSQGTKFERKVADLIEEKVGNDNFINIEGDINPRSYEKYLKTVQSIKNGVPVIYQGILRNYTNQTYGIPDLLIRQDYLDKIITSLPKSHGSVKEPKNNQTKRLKKNKKQESDKCYVVVDIKFKTLHFKSDGIHLRNDGPMKAYKAQLCVYNDALNTIQDQNQTSAYLLGWKWKYTRKGIDHSGDSCFDKLGRINYEGPDKEFVGKTAKAIEWILNVRKNGHKWDLTRLPLPHEELYPNMCNRYDYPYHSAKVEFAQKIQDISLIWKCGPKQRKIAHSNGIYSWKDPRCDAEALGIGGEFTSGVVDTILKANHTSSKENILPKYITNNFGGWKNKQRLELFVDFEMTCSVFTDFDDLPYSDSESLIFMIGVGYVDSEGEWIYKDFTVNGLTSDEELTICCNFIEYVSDLIKEYNCDEPSIYHWSHAEPSAWNRAMLRHPVDSYSWPELNWTDLLKVFHAEPVGIKGCLTYGLKDVGKTFHKYGYIKTVWDGNSACADGADVALSAYKIDKEIQQKEILFGDHPLTDEIIRYNEIDCKVLQEIITHLRENHVDPNDNQSIRLIDYDFGDSDDDSTYETENESDEELEYFSDEDN